ncbi:DegT/DnrJ/EryC1/StrS family aminotransferase [Bacillus pseudomycoides]|uniref:DegT/DnrJ/EryC1/StrS family aminotransferase n=1 Tax=Bacillus pseudomycoides TaxID=64104 RepID=UPI00159BEB0F|nr:DegT/DnrJ/EryC1/StrS aminotransferase family protein [Bacillus pseudomycoides]
MVNIPPTHIIFNNDDREKILSEINTILLTGQLTLGKWTKKFEEDFGKFHSKNEDYYAVAVNSGTSALEILFRSYNLQNEEILIPTNTFFATALAAHHAGAKVRYIDTEENKPWISLNKIKEVITPKTKAIVVVHIGGYIIPDIKEISIYCKENNIVLIEDAAHAHGSILHDKLAGTFGDAAAFSFYPTKVITSGEGGMILTNDVNIAKEASLYRDQGKESFNTNTHGKYGYNWRMGEINALIGYMQLSRLEEFIYKRKEVAKNYNESLKCINQYLEPLETNCGSLNYYKFIVLIKDKNLNREKLKSRLSARGVILGGEVYSTPCHLQPVYKGEYDNLILNNSIEFCNKHICLPISPLITNDNVVKVIDSLKSEIEFLLSEVQI